MAKRPQDMSLDELAQEMNKREDSLDHLTAKAEITRRQTAAQLDATRATISNAKYMLACVIVAAIAAMASAASAYFAFLSSLANIP
jgi:ABC-type transporter Mla subunit MlaD